MQAGKSVPREKQELGGVQDDNDYGRRSGLKSSFICLAAFCR